MFSGLFDALQAPSLAREISPPAPSGSSFHQQLSASSTPAGARPQSADDSDRAASDAAAGPRATEPRDDDRPAATSEERPTDAPPQATDTAVREDDPPADDPAHDAAVAVVADGAQPIREASAASAAAEAEAIASVSSPDEQAAEQTKATAAARQPQARTRAVGAAEALAAAEPSATPVGAAEDSQAEAATTDAVTIAADADASAGAATTNEGPASTAAAFGAAKHAIGEPAAPGAQRAVASVPEAEAPQAVSEDRPARVAAPRARRDERSADEPALEVQPTPESDSPRPGSSSGSQDGSAARSATTQISDRGSTSGGRSVESDLLPPGLNDLERTRLVQRVAKAFQHVDSEGGSVRIRLSPPELGSLKIELSVHGGVLAARLEAENPVTRSLLLEHLPALRERLAEQQIRVERFDVDLSQRDPGQGGQAWTDQQSEAPWQRTTGRGTRRGASPSRGDEAATAPRQRLVAGRFNVLV